jgi:hypothetical protein
MKKYGILDSDLKNALVKNRDFGIDARGKNLTTADRVKMLEDKLMSNKFTNQEAADIRAEIKRLKENYNL